MAPLHNDSNKRAARPSVADRMRKTAGENTGTGARALMSRRKFLYGAIGAGAVAAIGAGAAAYSASVSADDAEVFPLDVPARQLSTLNDFEALETYEGSVQLVGEYDLPYGSLVWAGDDSVAACLLPTETGSPLAQVGLLFLSSGTCDTVLERAIGAGEGFEVYDARANGNGLVWTEANILRGSWRIYAAPIEDGAMGEPALLEEGDGTCDTPTLAVCGARAFWQVNPKATEAPSEADPLPARLMGATFGKQDPSVVFESPRRMSSPPYAADDTVTIAPRLDSPTAYYQLTNIDAATGEVLDAVTLPRAIVPAEGGYGKTGFMFSFPDIYDYSGAIANLGTYVPRSKPGEGGYGSVKWFGFARTPTAAPAWCGNLLVVKSTYSVCGVDLDAGTYFAIDVDNGADTYGEYLASTGQNDTFVTYTNIDHVPVGEAAIHTCRVKVWTTLA